MVTTLLLPLGLGGLGFVEPCTIGAHMVFLGTQERRPAGARLAAFSLFLALRVVVMAAFGAAVALAGTRLIAVQTGFWRAFGAFYLSIGVAFLTGGAGRLKRRVSLAPERWKWAMNPAVQGAAFGLNIPACAAPLLFALIGFAATGTTVGVGALTMALFALALSLPLAPLLLWPALRAPLMRIGEVLRGRGWPLGAVFVALGLWSIWFGFFVDPADWSG